MGTILNGRDGAEDNDFIGRVADFCASAMGKKFSARRDEAAIRAPEVINNGRHDAAMHVARNEEIKFVEFGSNFRVGKIDGGVDNRDFDFMLGEVSDQFLVERIEVRHHDVVIFATWVKDGRGAMVIFVEAIIIGRLSEAKNVNVLILVRLVVEDLDVIDGIDGVQERLIFLGEPMILPREEIFIFGVFVIKLVIAEADKDWSGLTELFEPAGEASQVGAFFDMIEGVNEVAGDENVVGSLLVCS